MDFSFDIFSRLFILLDQLRRLLSTKTVPRVEGPKSSPASSKATKFTFPHSQTPSGAKEWH